MIKKESYHPPEVSTRETAKSLLSAVAISSVIIFGFAFFVRKAVFKE